MFFASPRTALVRAQVAHLLLVMFSALALGCGSGEPEGPAAAPAIDEREACTIPTPLECEGRCVDPARDGDACGECGVACEQGSVCSHGLCVSECTGLYPDRCERSCVDLRGDREHCGRCGNACDVDELCSGGVCSKSCGAHAPDQCGELCVDLRSDPRFCGTCESRCGDGQLCVDGQCSDECSGSKPLECDGTCVDPLSDPRFCGSCDQRCGIDQVCSDGKCAFGCAQPTPTFCGGLCVDTESDARACGGCGSPCSPGAVCTQSTCALECLGGTTRCADECADLETDPQHCGACDAPCPEGQLCSGGGCADGCSGETPVRCGSRCVSPADAESCGILCYSDTPSICGNACVDHDSDRQHCGACDHACLSGQVCNGGKCERECGGTTPDRCGDACVDLQTNADHCGTCPVACAAGASCIGGECVPACAKTTELLCAQQCVEYQSDEANCGVCGHACDADQRCDQGTCQAHILDIVGANAHVCALLVTGEVTCAGHNYFGQLGNALLDDFEASEYRLESFSAPVVELAANGDFTCARQQDDQVLCWGENNSGQLGAPAGSPTFSAEPLTIASLDSAPRRLALGTAHGCALTADDEVECWGESGYGALGRMVAGTSYEAEPVYGLPQDIGALGCGIQHCCVRLEGPSSSVYCWGSSTDGQLGFTSGVELATEITDVPAVDAGYEIATSLAVGGLHACALAGDGEVYCWGSNDMFQLGNATTTAQPPVKVEGLPGRAVAVYAGTRTSCAVLEDRRLACWGWHMGAGTDSADWPPAILVEQPVAKAGNLNGYAHFALTEAGHALSWGQYYYLLRRDIIPLYEPRRCCDTF